MARHFITFFAMMTFSSTWPALGMAQNDAAKVPPTKPAVLDLLMPAGATVALDGKELGETRSLSIDNLKLGEYRRVKLAVKYVDGSHEERLVDVAAGQRLTISRSLPGSEKVIPVTTQPLTPIQAAAWSRDGRFIALCMENVIVLWDTKVGRPVRTLTGHQKTVVAAAFNPKGNELLTGSADMTAMLWDPSTGDVIRTFKGHQGAISSVAFSPDGKKILTGSADRTAVLWKTESGEKIHTLTRHRREIMAVAYSPDGNTLGTSSADRSSTLWDASTGKEKFTLSGHREEVDCIAFSPDSSQAATGSFDDTAILWDVKTGKRIRAVRHPNDVYSVRFTPDGRRLVTGEREELVIIWNATNGQKAWTLTGHAGAVVSELMSPDGNRLLTASRDGTARLWNLSTGEEILTLTSDPSRKSWAVAASSGLFDGSGTGRQMLGFRFAKTVNVGLDQVFDANYHPGLLTEVCHGSWPAAPTPLGNSKPPLLKIVSPKPRVTPTKEMTFVVEATDQGGGISPLSVEQDGMRLAVPMRSEPGPNPRTTRSSFTVPLAPGSNMIRVKAAGTDGTWESVTADFELVLPRAPEDKTRMFIVAVGNASPGEKRPTLDFPARDAQALAELLQRHGGKLYDRIDVIPLYDRDATRTIIEDTVRDVAELTRPQDTLIVLLCGRGALQGNRFYFAGHDRGVGDGPDAALEGRSLAMNEVAEAIGTAKALKRVLIMDTAESGETKNDPLNAKAQFDARGAVERLARSRGIFILTAVGNSTRASANTQLGRGVLGHALLATARGYDGPAGAIDITDWFRLTAEKAAALEEKSSDRPSVVFFSAPAKGFPIMMRQR